jgi:hypothetical protein
MQTFHGAMKEEMVDMVHSFIIKLLPNSIQGIITTRGCQRVKGRKCLCRCHGPECCYVSSKEYQASGHVNGAHQLMAKDIKKHGWFWGMIHPMMKQNPTTTIAEALGQGEI